MKKMIRFCVVCGKRIEIVLDNKMNIISGGGYWPGLGRKQGIDFIPRNVSEQIEYWECQECMEE